MGESSARIGIYADDRASPTVKSVQGLMQGLAGEAKKSILTGVGLAGGVAAFSLLKNAIGGVTDFLGESIQQAIADEQSVKRLGQSLKANIPNWDGNTKAIEKRILAGQALGFSDDELRASMALLVGATHDVGKAQELQNAAMDLARFKGIDLASASDALVKVEGGRYRILASLGIQLGKNATQEEVLAAIQKVAAGQAKAFGETTAGAAAAAGIAFDELKEDIGRELLPVLKDLAIFARQTLIPVIRGVADAIGNVLDVSKATEDGVTDWVDILSIGLDQLTGGPLRRWGEDFRTTTEGAVVDAGNLSRQAANVLTAGASEVAAGAKAGITDPIWQAGYDAKQKAQQEAAKIPKAMGDAILAAEKDLTDSVKTLLTFLDEALTPAQERAAANAFLTSQAYANALASGKPAAVAKAAELANAALVVLWGATASGAAAGTGLVNAWVDAMIAAFGKNVPRTAAAVGAYSKMLRMAGSPDYTHAIEAGRGVGKAWVGGVNKELGSGSLNLPSLSDGGSLPSRSGRLGLPGRGGGAAPPEIHLHIEGPVYADGPAIDMMANKIAQRLRFAPGT